MSTRSTTSLHASSHLSPRNGHWRAFREDAEAEEVSVKELGGTLESPEELKKQF